MTTFFWLSGLVLEAEGAIGTLRPRVPDTDTLAMPLLSVSLFILSPSILSHRLGTSRNDYAITAMQES